tara:strand:+ start:1827 stop:2012 length:186 start_codon:yes stop_codon:yes gene_type:complete
MGLLIDISFVRYGMLLTFFRLFLVGFKYNIEEKDDVMTFIMGIWKCRINLKLILKGTANAL